MDKVGISLNNSLLNIRSIITCKLGYSGGKTRTYFTHLKTVVTVNMHAYP